MKTKTKENLYEQRLLREKEEAHPYLSRGLHCKACDKPITTDPELCDECLQVVEDTLSDYETSSKVSRK